MFVYSASLFKKEKNSFGYDLMQTHWHSQYPKTGAILVFLPGMGEIMTLLEQLQNHKTFSPKNSDR